MLLFEVTLFCRESELDIHTKYFHVDDCGKEFALRSYSRTIQKKYCFPTIRSCDGNEISIYCVEEDLHSAKELILQKAKEAADDAMETALSLKNKFELLSKRLPNEKPEVPEIVSLHCAFVSMDRNGAFVLNLEEIPCYRVLATHKGVTANIDICDFELGHVFSVIDPLYVSKDKLAKIYAVENITAASDKLMSYVAANEGFLRDKVCMRNFT